MNNDFLIEAIGNIDFEIIDEAENYRPKRKSRVWIWTSASAACLMIIGILAFPNLIDSNNNVADDSGRVHFAGKPNGEYSNYGEAAENGSVVISDELTRLMEAYNDYPDDEFLVHIYDENGAHSEVVWDTCLEPLGLTSDYKEGFLNSGIAALTKAQINAIKGSPQVAVVIETATIEVTEEYLKTVNGPLKVWVFTNLGLDEALVGHEGEERIQFCKKYVDEHFSEYEKDHGLNREEFEYFGIFTGTFTAELDKEKVAELLADKRTSLICVDTESENQYPTDF